MIQNRRLLNAVYILLAICPSSFVYASAVETPTIGTPSKIMGSPTEVTSEIFHTPAQILKFVNDSKLTYVFNLEKYVPLPAKPPQTLENGRIVIVTSDGRRTIKVFNEAYGSNPRYCKAFQNAETHFNNHNYAEARQKYMEVISIAEDQSQVMGFIGQTLRIEKDYLNAEIWYRKALKINPADFMAHWGLSTVLYLTNRKDLALRELIIAHICNLNDSRILGQLKTMSKELGLEFQEWEFTPRFRISKVDNQTVNIDINSSDMDWLIYADAKALWQFEPHHKESILAASKRDPRTTEERYCLASLAMSAENKSGETKKPIITKSIQELVNAIKLNRLDSYIAYEIFLREKPDAVLVWDSGAINAIADYLMAIRFKKL